MRSRCWAAWAVLFATATVGATFVTVAQTKRIKAGDVVIIPIGVYHGFSEIPDHIEYVTVRPDLERVLPAGYIYPVLRGK